MNFSIICSASSQSPIRRRASHKPNFWFEGCRNQQVPECHMLLDNNLCSFHTTIDTIALIKSRTLYRRRLVLEITYICINLHIFVIFLLRWIEQHHRRPSCFLRGNAHIFLPLIFQDVIARDELQASPGVNYLLTMRRRQHVIMSIHYAFNINKYYRYFQLAYRLVIHTDNVRNG